MTVTVFVFLVECRFDSLQALPWQVEGIALALVTDIDAEVDFYIVIAAIGTVIARDEAISFRQLSSFLRLPRFARQLLLRYSTNLHPCRNRNDGFYSDNDDIKINLSVDVRYQGQSNALNLPWQGLQEIEAAFHQKHKDSYGHDLAIDIELVNVRVRAIEQRQSFVLPKWQATEKLNEQFTTMPGVVGQVPVINRASLKVGQRIQSPALIVETSSTTWLDEGWDAEVDKVGNLKLVKV